MGLIHEDVSYQIIGALFDAYNTIGPSHKELYCQRAVAKMFDKRDLEYQEQVVVPLEIEGERIGNYRLDFLVSGIVVVELKVGRRFRKQDFIQANAYLRSMKKQLAILALFGPRDLLYKRVVNI